MYRHFLIPTDGSELAERAVTHAFKMEWRASGFGTDASEAQGGRAPTRIRRHLRVISLASVEAASSLRVTLSDLDNLGPTNTYSIGNKL